MANFADESPEVKVRPTLPPTHKDIPAETIAFARELRQQQTDAENLIWQLVRDRRLAGFKFRRQHPLPPYVADFYCHEARLCIELDGGQHAIQQEYDRGRDTELRARGIRTLRFWNNQVLAETEAVLQVVWSALQEAALTPNPSPEWRGEPAAVFPAAGHVRDDGAPVYRDIPGLCKAATLSEVEGQGWSLNPGRYVGVAPGEEVSDEDFKEQLETLNEELEVLNAEALELQNRISQNVASLLS